MTLSGSCSLVRKVPIRLTSLPRFLLEHQRGGISIEGAVATVDLDRRFESGGGSLSMTLRVAQVVFTVTELPGVNAVLFELDGQRVDTIGGEGIDVSRPTGRNDYLSAKPFILASEPRPGQVISSPLRIVGENSTFENNVEIALKTTDGRVLVQTFATGTGPIRDDQGQPVWGPFETSFEFYSGSAPSGVLSLTETASDGSGRLLADYSIPVTFAPVSVVSPPALDGASTDPVAVPPDACCDPGPGVLLQGVTMQRESGFERIVFEFSAPVASYHVRYVPLPITEDPSDLPVSLQGDSAIQVTVGATGLDQSQTPARQTYQGPYRLKGAAGSVVELTQTGDFEAVLNWAIGVRGRPTFRVTTDSNPNRLIVDVASN